MENHYKNNGTDGRIERNTEIGAGRAYGDDSPASRNVEVEMIMRTKIEKFFMGNRRAMRMLTLAATLLFAGAVIKITADKLPEGIIFFIAAACFLSLERACSRKTDETGNNSETNEHEVGDNE